LEIELEKIMINETTPTVIKLRTEKQLLMYRIKRGYSRSKSYEGVDFKLMREQGDALLADKIALVLTIIDEIDAELRCSTANVFIGGGKPFYIDA
jgi:hypothetical protein